MSTVYLLFFQKDCYTVFSWCFSSWGVGVYISRPPTPQGVSMKPDDQHFLRIKTAGSPCRLKGITPEMVIAVMIIRDIWVPLNTDCIITSCTDPAPGRHPKSKHQEIHLRENNGHILNMGTCTISGCFRAGLCKKMCLKHYDHLET